MFQLERVSLHDWYLLEGTDIEVSGSVALLGQTGAGKSAIVDAIQTVMGGNNRNVIKLNSAAGEARDRRVAEYCLGCVTDINDGAPLRRSSETVLALTFARQMTGERVAFGLLLAASADEPGAERTVARFVIRGHGFRMADFVDREPGGARFMVGHEVMLGRMKERFRKAFTLHPTSQAYVQEYLTAMRPMSSPDPRRFLVTFSNALAAREIKDPTHFVRRFVLEPNPLNVRRVRESIATWRELQAEAVRLEEMLRAAREVRGRFITWARQRIGRDGAAFTAAHAERLRLGIEAGQDDARMAALQEELRGIEAQSVGLLDEERRLEEDNTRDRLLAAQSATAARRIALEGERNGLQRARDVGAKALGDAVRPYVGAVQLARLRDFLPASAGDGIRAAVELAGITALGQPAAWAAQWVEVGALASRVAALARVGQLLQQQEDAAAEDLAGWRAELSGLDAQIAAASQAGTLMSAQTLRFRQELAARGITAAAMPDVVEVPDERWAFALEALLGAHREALIVPAAQLDEAFQVLFRLRSQLDGCRLVNTRKTGAARAHVPAGSIAEAATTSNSDARAFIDAHVGRYVRAEHEAGLARLDQGVMANGKTSQGLGLRVFRDRPPILGRTAQAAAREAAVARRAEVASLLAAAAARRPQLQGGLRRLAARAAAGAPGIMEGGARALADAIDRLAAIDGQLAAVDGDDQDGLGPAIRGRSERIAANRRERDGLDRRVKEAYGTLGALERDLAAKEGRMAALLAREAELSSAQGGSREAWLIGLSEAEAISALRTRIENRLGLDWLGREARALRQEEEEATKRVEEGGRQIPETLRRADGALRQYLSDVERGNPLPDDADESDKLRWIDGRFQRIEAHELRPHQDRLQTARDEMEHMLKEDLLAKLDERLQGARRQIDILNRRLSGHAFVGQPYSFTRRPNERLRPLAELARHVAANPRLDFKALQQAELPPALRSALADIERIVGTEDDVAEIEDYRTYYEFDLQLRQGEEKPVSFSSVMGKLSGGQRQAPYYVAIAASMVSVYYPGGRTGDADGMGLVLFDEAFNKLDVRTTRALLELFHRLGLQVVVAAPEMNRATFLESVDTIATVARQPGTADIYLEAMQPGPCAKAAMRAANPEHRGVAGFRPLAAPSPDRSDAAAD